MLLQQQVEVNRMFALQQAVEQMRNRLETLEGLLVQLIQQSKEYILLQEPAQPLKKQKRKELSHEPSKTR